MRVLLIILIKKDLPEAVKFFEGMDFFNLEFGNKLIDHLMIFFHLLSEYSDKRCYPKFFIIRTFSGKPGVMRLIY
jgi:hypothetical protein